MTIRTNDLDSMLDVIQGLVERGLGFAADTRDFTITLTGAH